MGYDQLIPAEKLTAGMYRVKVEFIHNALSYYVEKQVLVRK
jgi:hypothetical protein